MDIRLGYGNGFSLVRGDSRKLIDGDVPLAYMLSSLIRNTTARFSRCRRVIVALPKLCWLAGIMNSVMRSRTRRSLSAGGLLVGDISLPGFLLTDDHRSVESVACLRLLWLLRSLSMFMNGSIVPGLGIVPEPLPQYDCCVRLSTTYCKIKSVALFDP